MVDPVNVGNILSFRAFPFNQFIRVTMLFFKVTWWNFDRWLGPPGHPPRWLTCSNSWLQHQHWWISNMELETLKDRYHPTT